MVLNLHQSVRFHATKVDKNTRTTVVTPHRRPKWRGQAECQKCRKCSRMVKNGYAPLVLGAWNIGTGCHVH